MMRARVSLNVTALWLSLVIGAPAIAQPAVNVVRTGNHADYGRVVFDLSRLATAQAEQVGPRVLVHLDPPAELTFGKLPRNVLVMTQTGDGAEIILSPGARMRLSRPEGRLVIDAVDAPQIRVSTGPINLAKIVHSVAPDSIARERQASGASASVESAPANVIAPTSAVAILLAPEAAPAPTIGSLALVARPAGEGTTDPVSRDQAIILPFAAATGAAAFRRGDAAFVVFDERRPIDMSQLRDVLGFSDATITVLPEGTQLRIPLPPQKHLVLARTTVGWSVMIGADDRRTTTLKPFAIAPDHGRLMVPADQPGRVISVPDPLTGGVVLVGTQLAAGQGMPVASSAPEFGLLETWQGLAVKPLADALQLTPVQSGFVLALDPQRPLAVSPTMPQTVAENAVQGFSRRFDFPNLPSGQLQRRLQSAIAEASAAPSQSRGRKRIAAAQAMLALRLGVEAQALLTLAATDDAMLADDPVRIGLSAIAALLAGRMTEADTITDPRLDGSDDVTLWRAIRLALRDEGAPAAATNFATLSNLMLTYPASLRTVMLPLLAETMALGGETDAATVLVKTNLNEEGLDFSRALLAARDPARVLAALESLDRLAASNDRLLHVRAAIKAIEVRLAAHMITPSVAADAMDRQIYAWRGDEREMATRLRVAELRTDSNEWRPALRLLRETSELWPNATATLQPRMVATFMRALATDSAAPLAPLELLALADENADLIPTGEAGQALSARLADRLIALDLPQRAIPLLTRLLDQTEQGTARSAIGGKLAAMQMQMGKPNAALAALNDTLGLGSLPAVLLEQRTLIYARAANDVGQHDQAIAVLEALGTLDAVQMQAQFQEAARNWHGALQVLQHLTAMSVPTDGPLDETHARNLLRLASAAAQVGAVDVLDHLRAHDLPRLPAGKSADLTRLITSGPVQKPADLPRSAQETRNLSAAVKGAGI